MASEIDSLSAEFVTDTVDNLRKLTKHGIPHDVEDLQKRIDAYFSFCATASMRPGIESLSLSLGCTRATFWNWCSGKSRNRDPEWQQTCLRARQIIIAFLETASLNGKINPATSIFMLKNWAGYADSCGLDTEKDDSKPEVLSLADLPRFNLLEEESD